MSPRVGVFHPGTQHSWQTALAFQESQQLAWYATSVFYDQRRWPYRVERYLPGALGQRIQREFRRRYTPLLDPDNILQFGTWEWLETGARRLNWGRVSSWCNRRGNTLFGRSLIRRIERDPPDVLWGYNESSVEVFRWAKKNGIVCVLDQTIGHQKAWADIMSEERDRHPDFFEDSYRTFTPELLDQQTEEMELADLVVVGSDFCARTMIENGCAADKVRVMPYGYDETIFPDKLRAREPLVDRPVRFLFVGQVDPRKGVAYLFEAFKNIPESQATLTVVGRLAVPQSTFARYSDRINYVPQVPRSEVPEYFLQADCFVFPSLFEGGGIVLYEACGAGLGLIQSDACGDGVRKGRNGSSLRNVTVEALTETIERVLQDRTRLAEWQEASSQMREERTWAQYRERIRGIQVS